MLRAHIALKNHAKIFWGYRIINFEKKEKILQMHYECCAYVPLKTSGGPRRAGFLVFKVRIGLSTKSNSISNPT